MTFRIISYGSAEHDAMIKLRNKVLREPLGLIFSEQDLLKEKDDHLIGGYTADNRIIGACVLTHVDENTIQLRQMAIDENHQKRGVGSEILTFAESVASEYGYGCICLHARETAIEFYKKAGYNSESEIFIEVGIPHCEMKKQI